MKIDKELKLDIKINWITLSKKGEEIIRLYFCRIFDIPEDARIDGLKSPVIHIIRLYVSPEYRNKGYGSLLMRLLFENKSDIQDFVVLASPDEESVENRIRLLNFYKSFGFEVVDEEDEGTFMHCKRKTVKRKK